MERFTVATLHQLEVQASAHQAWVRLHDFENLHNVFSTVHAAESIGIPWVVGSKIKVTRLLPTKHCFLATYTIVKHDEEKMEFQIFSEDIASPGAATVSTTWNVESLAEDRCLVTISIALVPRKMFVSAGRLIFAPFLKQMVKRTIKQDLKDLAASFEKEQVNKTPLQQSSSSKASTRISKPTKNLMYARKFEEPKKDENSERTRATLASNDDASSVTGMLYCNNNATRATPLGLVRQQEDFTNIRQVQWR